MFLYFGAAFQLYLCRIEHSISFEWGCTPLENSSHSSLTRADVRGPMIPDHLKSNPKEGELNNKTPQRLLQNAKTQALLILALDQGTLIFLADYSSWFSDLVRLPGGRLIPAMRLCSCWVILAEEDAARIRGDLCADQTKVSSNPGCIFFS